MSTVQYRLMFAKKDEVVEGADDADLVISVGAADALGDPTTAFMQGKLKSTGSTGALFALLQSGEAATVLRRLAVRP